MTAASPTRAAATVTSGGGRCPPSGSPPASGGQHSRYNLEPHPLAVDGLDYAPPRGERLHKGQSPAPGLGLVRRADAGEHVGPVADLHPDPVAEIAHDQGGL